MAVTELLGLPSTRGRLPLLAAQGVDALGTGLFLPFALVYFHAAKGVPLATVGAALSLAALLALPAGVSAGPLVDRFGPRRVVVAANLLRVVTFTGYVFSGSLWQLVALAAATFWGEGLFWPASGALVAQVADDGQRVRWYAMERTLRNLGLGVGGLAGGVLVAGGGTGGYTAIVLLNAATFLLAAALVATWRAGASAGPQAVARTAPRGGYRAVFADRTFRLVLVTVLVFALCDLAFTVLLSAYVLDVLRLPAWQPGVLFALNTVLVVLGQTVVASRVERFGKPRTLRAAAGVWAVSFLVFAAAPAGTPIPAFAVLTAATVVFTAAELLQAPAGSALIVALAPPHLRGRYLGLEELVWGAARVLAPVTFTALLTGGPRLPWFVLTGCALVAVVVLAGVRERADA
ncbi:MFS transporter [Amycolatopsis australiensis]|uniref:Na+/melibiose symporter n=1 Tax=Amycolatopsis australiensis TaxID=546364 RepID=A0A1K1SIM8_9PSEU|nr:MFS transporter [Amycolatopsis australiensis]SFW83927.1 Na+/melibiose symporter [Amycolatopsis australiensis]